MVSDLHRLNALLQLFPEDPVRDRFGFLSPSAGWVVIAFASAGVLVTLFRALAGTYSRRLDGGAPVILAVVGCLLLAYGAGIVTGVGMVRVDRNVWTIGGLLFFGFGLVGGTVARVFRRREDSHTP
jgi:hypothetical protein